ncbi:hypothetical protein ACWCYZ_16735 [Streptomyces virginiae]|uniref:hypothetical protein n=1 Tax=Streptomyces virginiae TaxID=1961 RepID=UPI0036511AE1
MTSNLHAAIETAARHSISAPEMAPAVDVPSGALGALIVGIILCTMIIVRWKSDIYKDAEKKAIIHTALAVMLLAGTGGGLVASAFSSVQQAGNGVGSSITQTGFGR